jgi:hypothetical protein
MSNTPLKNGIFIIRTQSEYSPISKTVSIRAVLEMPMTGQQIMCVDVETLLSVLKAEISETHKQIIPEQKEGKP